MKRLDSVITAKVQLEVVECDCGFHLGVDATYLDQVGDFKIACPSCGASINTAVVFPADTMDISAYLPNCLEQHDPCWVTLPRCLTRGK